MQLKDFDNINSENDGFPSSKYQEYLVLNDDLFESKLRELKNKEVIELYEYILKEAENDDSIVDKDRLDEIIELMNKKTIIQHYNKGTLSSLDSDYLEENYSNLEDTIKIMVQRKRMSLGQRLMNFLRK